MNSGVVDKMLRTSQSKDNQVPKFFALRSHENLPSSYMLPRCPKQAPNGLVACEIM